MKIIIDPGHGGKDNGGGSNTYWKEKDMNLKISLYQYESFKKLGLDVLLTRDKDIFLGYKDRSEIVRTSGADICISNHINSYSDESVLGAVAIYSIHDEPKLARLILDGIVAQGAKERRIHTRTHPSIENADYYYMHRLTGDVETVIIEYGFASNHSDSIRILNNWKEYAQSVVKSICNYIGHVYDEKVNETKLLGNPTVTVFQMKQWAKNRGATEKFINVADIYMKYGELTGIRSDILYCQSAKETNFGKYTGIVKENMNNFAGIKTQNPHGDTISDFEEFGSIDDGIRAHFNHISAYIGIEPIGIPHDRYYVVKSLDWAGTIRFVKELSQKWATDVDYGESIVKNYLLDLEKTQADTPNYKELYEKCKEEKILLEEILKDIIQKFKCFLDNIQSKEVD